MWRRTKLLEETSDLLRRGIRELGLPAVEGQIASFMTYLAELSKWNRAYNLTALSSPGDIIIKHFLDSLLFGKVLPRYVRTLADVGSGAGFPGIPLKIVCPALKIYLIEPTQKKALFLKHICSILGLQGVDVINKRIEAVDRLKVDAAVTRALFSAGDFLKKAGGILNAGGILVLSKGPKVSGELKGIGPGMVSRLEFRLPFTDVIRHLVVIRP